MNKSKLYFLFILTTLVILFILIGVDNRPNTHYSETCFNKEIFAKRFLIDNPIIDNPIIDNPIIDNPTFLYSKKITDSTKSNNEKNKDSLSVINKKKSDVKWEPEESESNSVVTFNIIYFIIDKFKLNELTNK